MFLWKGMAMTTLERLKLAKERLKRPENWIRHLFSNGHGKYCLLGACDYLSGGGSVESPLRQAIQELYPDGWGASETVVRWNDYVASHSEVLAVLDKAIELETGR